MHTLEGTEVRFHYNGDFSGFIECVCKYTGKAISIPNQDLKDLVAEFEGAKNTREEHPDA